MGTRKRDKIGQNFRSMMYCICSGDQIRANETVLARELVGGVDRNADSGDIEEAESSLRESGSLNFEEARAMLGRYEYQKGNVEAALQVFEGIDINAVTPRIKATLSKRMQHNRHSESDEDLNMSTNAASLLLEAIFLKAKSLQAVGKFAEAAQSCKVILDIVESSLPDGLPENFGSKCKLQETLIKTVELVPELWKLAISPEETISSYRRALLYRWNLDNETTARIQQEFAIYLLYSGSETGPYLGAGLQSFVFVPGNNIEEAILILMLLLKKAIDHIIVWDPEILDHLSFALSVSGSPYALARLVEELLPGIISREQRFHTLALSYYADGDSFAALNLLRKLLTTEKEATFVPGLLVASKICGQNSELAEEGVRYARKSLENMGGRCNKIAGTATYLLAMSLSQDAKLSISYAESTTRQSEAIDVLKSAWNLTEMSDPRIAYQLSLQLAEKRKLDSALHYAKEHLKLEGGSNIKGWVLMARILSAQKKFGEAETVIDAALEQSVQSDQSTLLRTKAKIQLAQGHLKEVIQTYTQLLAVLHLQRKNIGPAKKHSKIIRKHDQNLESETWQDLIFIYMSLSSWNDVEACLSKFRTLSPYSAAGWHALGSFHEAKGLFKEALEAYTVALSIDLKHVPSLISSAVVLKLRGKDDTQSFAVARSFLMQALSLDRMDHDIWYQLGLLYKAQGIEYIADAVECFEAASVLEDTSPVEPFSK